MRWGARAAVGVACTVALAVPGSAAATSFESTATGSLDVTWQGDTARGCAAAGVCGVAGSLQVHLEGGSSASSGGPITVDINGSSSVARVTNGAPGLACTDAVPVEFTLELHRSLAVLSQNDGPGTLPSAGRCAGPTTQDLSGLSFALRKLRGGRYRIFGRQTLGAGPFDVTVIPAINALVRSPAGSSFITSSAPVGTPPKARHVLEEDVTISYRVSAITGAVNTSIVGVGSPWCDPFGACGSTGALSTSLIGGGGVLTLQGAREVKRRITGTSQGLADVRRGRLPLSGFLESSAITAETIQGTGSSSCTDTGPAIPVSGPINADRAEARVGIELPNSGGGGFSFGPDPLRTRCPGPTSGDAFPGGTLASGTIPASVIGDQRITLTLGTGGSYKGPGYEGAQSGSLFVSLTRASVRVVTSRQTVYAVRR